MKNSKHLILFVLFVGFITPDYAQSPIYIGNIKDVTATYKKKAQIAADNMANPEAQVNHLLPQNKQLVLQLRSSKREGSADLFFGEVHNSEYSNFYLKITGSKASGSIVMRKEKKFYRFASTPDGSIYLTEEDIDKVLCIDLPESQKTTSEQERKGISLDQPRQTGTIAPAIPILESLPGAGAVVYLDFDGEYVTNTLWNSAFNQGNPIDAAPANLTETEMTEVWKLMSEDFRPFQLNVTTNVAVFNNAPIDRRMRVIFTPTNYFNPGWGGYAYIGSFTWGGTSNGETPCWAWNSGIKGAGEVGSHEVGHTLGLVHDGRTSPSEVYFYGQNSWAPIMGAGYSVPVVQWSMGEYPNANNNEDDLDKITTLNGFGYRADDHGNTINSATPLVVDAEGNVSEAANKGIISTRTDVDVFSITTGGGTVALTVNPDPNYPNLDISVNLLNSAGTVVATADSSTMAALLEATVAAGTYYLTIDGATGTLGANSDYASLGSYSISTKDYCLPVYTDGCTNFAILINNFSFNTLVNNNSGCSNGTGKGYTNYAPADKLTTSVNRGESYNLKMQSADYAGYFGVWIDYNNDKDFDDEGEFVYTSPSASTNQFSATITIPATVTLGQTRMRVRSNYDPAITSAQSCSSMTWGEAEDYTITIATDSCTPVTPAISIAVSPGTSVCIGSKATFTATITNGGTTPVYQWKKNGMNVGTNGKTYLDSTLKNGDSIYCVLTSNTTCATKTTASNKIKMTVKKPATPTASITVSPDTSVCKGTRVTFTAMVTKGGTKPIYQWKKNGLNVGTNSNTLVDSALRNGDSVYCVLASNATCVTAGIVSSNGLKMTVKKPATPTVSIAVSPGTSVCTGSLVTFTATITKGGASPIYQWKKNGLSVGSNRKTYTDSALKNGDTIYCVLTSNAVCATTATAKSNIIKMTVSKPVKPSVSIAANPSTSVCIDSKVTFIAIVTKVGTSPVYQWKKNEINVGSNSKTYVDAALKNGDSIYCVLTSNAACATPATIYSNGIKMIVNTCLIADISFQPSTMLKGGSNKLSVTATPNPFNNSVQVTVTSPASTKAAVLITAITGQTVYKQDVMLKRDTNVIPLTVSGLSAGTYYVQVVANGETKSCKIIKE